MNLFKKRNLIILAGLIFVTSASLDPLHHDYSGDQISDIECHFCNIESSEPVQSNIFVDQVFHINLIKVKISENLFSYNSKNFYSRAPPKI